MANKSLITDEAKVKVSIGSGLITAGTIKLMGATILASTGVGIVAAIATGWFMGKAARVASPDQPYSPTADGEIPHKQVGDV